MNVIGLMEVLSTVRDVTERNIIASGDKVEMWISRLEDGEGIIVNVKLTIKKEDMMDMKMAEVTGFLVSVVEIEAPEVQLVSDSEMCGVVLSSILGNIVWSRFYVLFLEEYK